jgi:hypothetical protein
LQPFGQKNRSSEDDHSPERQTYMEHRSDTAPFAFFNPDYAVE